jgi:hypothetical protein
MMVVSFTPETFGFDKKGGTMPAMKRFKTDYVGVYYVRGHAVGTGKPERIFYVAYRRNGKLIEEKAGRQFSDAMSAARASRIRGERIEGKTLPNRDRRAEKARKKETEVWTLERLWREYKAIRLPNLGPSF